MRSSLASPNNSMLDLLTSRERDYNTHFTSVDERLRLRENTDQVGPWEGMTSTRAEALLKAGTCLAAEVRCFIQ